MAHFLQFGVLVYLITTTLQGWLAVQLIRRKYPYFGFVTYTTFVFIRSVVMFTLLWFGNSGQYAAMFDAIQALDVPLICWIIGEQIGWQRVSLAIGIFGGIYTYGFGLNKWTLFALSFAAMLAMLKESVNRYVLSGVVLMIVFPAVIAGYAELPGWTMFVPTFSFLVSQLIWMASLAGAASVSRRAA